MHPTNHRHTHGSSVYQGEHELDQERAASMADEGGVSGAITDAREQAQGAMLARAEASEQRRWLWALGALGAALSIFALLRLRAR